MLEKLIEHPDIFDYFARNFLTLGNLSRLSRLNSKFRDVIKQTELMKRASKEHDKRPFRINYENNRLKSFLMAMNALHPHQVFSEEEAVKNLLNPRLENLKYKFSNHDMSAGFDLVYIYMYGISYPKRRDHYIMTAVIGKNSAKANEILKQLKMILTQLTYEGYEAYQDSLKEEFTSLQNNHEISNEVSLEQFRTSLLEFIEEKIDEVKLLLSKRVEYIDWTPPGASI